MDKAGAYTEALKAVVAAVSGCLAILPSPTWGDEEDSAEREARERMERIAEELAPASSPYGVGLPHHTRGPMQRDVRSLGDPGRSAREDPTMTTEWSDEAVRDAFPPEWWDEAIMFRTIEWQTSLSRAVVLHGLIALVLKHPDLPEASRTVGDQMLTHLEEALEAEGLPPPYAGWRAEVEP